MSCLFARIGGGDALAAAVDLFYRKLAEDPRVRHFFADTDLTRQARHQVRFLTYALGGTPGYPGRSLRASHRRLVEEKGLNDAHFDAVVGILDATLGELGIGRADIAAVLERIEATRSEVLDRPNPMGSEDATERVAAR